jgi:hypothetical protein
MFRALNVLAGMVFFLTGGVGSFIVWCNTYPEQWAGNGFTLLAGVGAILLGLDLVIEQRQEVDRHV